MLKFKAHRLRVVGFRQEVNSTSTTDVSLHQQEALIYSDGKLEVYCSPVSYREIGIKALTLTNFYRKSRDSWLFQRRINEHMYRSIKEAQCTDEKRSGNVCSTYSKTPFFRECTRGRGYFVGRSVIAASHSTLVATEECELGGTMDCEHPRIAGDVLRSLGVVKVQHKLYFSLMEIIGAVRKRSYT